MEKTPIIDTLSSQAEIVTSTYADLYFNHYQCDKVPVIKRYETKKHINNNSKEESWDSPSDLMIGKVDLVPPFTSKIFRGITHQGILAIGDNILEKEQGRFNKYMSSLLSRNDAAWNSILKHEKEAVERKVEDIAREVLDAKRKVLMNEINKFYENTLQELEDHFRYEINSVLISAHAHIVSDLNVEIEEKLKEEYKILDKELENRYNDEVLKLKHYYELLLENEKYKNNKLVNKAIYERNDALRAFYRQIDAQNTTSTMYVMCTERKKCKIKQFLVENFQNMQLAEQLKKIKDCQNLLKDYKKSEKHILEINKEWEEKIKKVLKLFLKFISFGLKLLPDQATFLLDLEKMVILQLNEIQKSPSSKTSILVNMDNNNLFIFKDLKSKEMSCDKEPFELVGDLSEPAPRQFDSHETLPDDVELPVLRLERQFVYAKCNKFNEVKDLLKLCKCPSLSVESSGTTSQSAVSVNGADSNKSESSLDSMIIDDITILRQCPTRRCHDWIRDAPFPFMPSYLDFTEENYERVKAILKQPSKKAIRPELIDVNSIGAREFVFAATRERNNNLGTQYSSQEDLELHDFKCPCTEGYTGIATDIHTNLKQSPEEKRRELDQIILKRKTSLQNLIHAHPSLLKMFTDKDFDFVYTIQ